MYIFLYTHNFELKYFYVLALTVPGVTTGSYIIFAYY